jgi:hypothetical protein
MVENMMEEKAIRWSTQSPTKEKKIHGVL